MRIALERMMSKEDLISEENVKLVEEVSVKDINKALICDFDLLDNMVEHVVHQM